MVIKLRDFALVLDRITAYQPGNLVTGVCIIKLDGQMNLNKLVIKFEGKARCKWSTGGKASRTYSAKRVYFHEKYCPGDSGETLLTAGEHRIQFVFHLPQHYLPSSFEGRYGSIRYKVKAKINTPIFNIDKRREVMIPIQSSATCFIERLLESVSHNDSKYIGIFGPKKVTMSCHLQKMGHNIGSNIAIECRIDNQTNKTMDLRASLKQHVFYTAEGGHQETKDKIMVVDGSSIRPKSNQIEVLYLPVPFAPTTLMTSPEMIKIQYELVVTLVISGNTDLHCILPVILTTDLPIDPHRFFTNAV